jgi:hypothetical protein
VEVVVMMLTAEVVLLESCEVVVDEAGGPELMVEVVFWFDCIMVIDPGAGCLEVRVQSERNPSL